jgi:KDO2-lipid IV(A) lauroyltransferase
MQTALARAATVVLPCLPYSAVRAIARCFGWLAYRLDSGARQISLANLDVVFSDAMPRAEKERIACRSMQSLAATILTLFWSRGQSRERLDKIVELDAECLARFREALARGKGVVYATLHYGNWELLALAGGHYGMPLQIVAETMRNEAVGRLIARLRAGTGNHMIPQRGAAPKLLRAVRHGEAAVLLIDQNAPEEGGGEWLEFFGLPAFNNVLAAALAVRTGAALFSCHAMPLPNGQVRLVYGPEIPYTVTGDYDADVRRVSQQCLAHFEELIRAQPEFWLWSYKRWKHRRDAGDTRYPFYTSPGVLPTRKTTSA